MNISRRGFLGAILAAGSAPFVVKAESLMAVRVPTSGLIASTSASRIQQIKAEILSYVDDDIPRELARQLGERMALMREMIAAGAWPITELHSPIPSSHRGLRFVGGIRMANAD